MDPGWKLQFLSDDDKEVEPSEDDFKESTPHTEKKKKFWSLIHGFLNFSKDAQNVGMLSSSRRTKLLVLC